MWRNLPSAYTAAAAASMYYPYDGAALTGYPFTNGVQVFEIIVKSLAEKKLASYHFIAMGQIIEVEAKNS
ncbi:hypothetical protein QR98_0094850 [Sarcoptes scabiei]|uniref:Uncharacterized protein n=1 Tax=Sarcoptes scabiei TaxID=52283 RepID=A0A132AKG2_SARSC|nr:hypothetical protein QR98_0094850 [Sarcoptes scabiei]